MNIIRDLGDNLENWNYEKLDETNRVAKIIKERINFSLMSFLNSVLNQSKKYENPFRHWELNKPLTEQQIDEIINADIADPVEHNLNYDGTRAIDGGEGKFREGISDGGKALKFRCFITKENLMNFQI